MATVVDAQARRDAEAIITAALARDAAVAAHLANTVEHPRVVLAACASITVWLMRHLAAELPPGTRDEALQRAWQGWLLRRAMHRVGGR